MLQNSKKHRNKNHSRNIQGVFCAKIVAIAAMALMILGSVSCSIHALEKIGNVHYGPRAYLSEENVSGHVNFNALTNDEKDFIKKFIQQDRRPYANFKDFFQGFLTTHPRLHGFIDYRLPQRTAMPVLILRNWIFSNVALANANFSGAALVNLNFHCSDISGADFSGAVIKNGIFTETKLIDANFLSADVKKASFRHADLNSANFLSADVEDANFSDAQLIHANFSGADVKKASFRHADLNSANFLGADVKDANFSGAELDHVNFTGAVGRY